MFVKQIEICVSTEWMSQYIISDKMPCTVQELESCQSFLISSKCFLVHSIISSRQAKR